MTILSTILLVLLVLTCGLAGYLGNKYRKAEKDARRLDELAADNWVTSVEERHRANLAEGRVNEAKRRLENTRQELEDMNEDYAALEKTVATKDRCIEVYKITANLLISKIDEQNEELEDLMEELEEAYKEVEILEDATEAHMAEREDLMGSIDFYKAEMVAQDVEIHNLQAAATVHHEEIERARGIVNGQAFAFSLIERLLEDAGSVSPEELQSIETFGSSAADRAAVAVLKGVQEYDEMAQALVAAKAKINALEIDLAGFVAGSPVTPSVPPAPAPSAPADPLDFLNNSPF